MLKYYLIILMFIYKIKLINEKYEDNKIKNFIYILYKCWGKSESLRMNWVLKCMGLPFLGLHCVSYLSNSCHALWPYF